ncbi:hypothetical protein ACN4FE_04565 [Aliarcobacter butzleri]|uniref:hypothetical protein n=1 Tax=Aliarcobacter butzleri TaxID=28197 RepID=UPI003AF9638D
MRISEINYKIQQIDTSKAGITYGTSSSVLTNLIKFKNLLNELEKNELIFYFDVIKELKSSELYSTTQDSIVTLASDAALIYSQSKYIVDSIHSLKRVFKEIIPISKENELSIKLPNTDNLENLLKDMSKIEKQLSIVVNDSDIQSYIQLSKWEHGSFWIDIIIGTPFAISVIGAITWSAAYISSQIKKNREHTLYLEKIETEVQMLKSIKEKQEQYLDKLYETEVLNIQENYFENNENNERNKKIKDTIKLFADMIQRGGEFQPSLISPKDIKDSYPDFKNIEYIPSKVQQISEKPESMNNQEVI